MKLFSKLSLLIFGYLLFNFLFSTTALAHPGHLGALTHLGPRTITLSIAAAALDSFNPTALGILLLLLRAQQKLSSSVVSVLRVGLLYVLGIVIMYLLAAYGINQLLLVGGPSLLTEGLQILLAFLLFLVGMREIDDVATQKTWFPWANTIVEKMLEFVRPTTKHIFPLLLGLVFGLVELFLTGAIYLSFIRGVTFDPTTHAGVLAAFISIYIFVFVLPLLVAMYFVVASSAFSALKKQTKLVIAFKTMMGLIFIVVAVWLAISSINILLTL